MVPHDDANDRTAATADGDFVSAETFTVAELRAALFEDVGEGGPKREGQRDRQERETGPLAELGPHVALSLLARKEYDGKADDLRRLLLDAAVEGRLRHSAAVALGRALGPDAEGTLLEALESETLGPEGSRGVLTALGEVGGEATLEAIAKHRDRLSEPGRRQADWAETLAAFRTRTPGRDDRGRLSLPDLAEFEGETFDVSLREADAEVRKAALEDLRRGNYRLPLDVSAEAVYELVCLNQRLLVLLDEAFVDAAAPLERKYVAAAVLERSRVETEEWSPRHYVLVQPEDGTPDEGETQKPDEGRQRGRGQVFVTTTNGRVYYAGTFGLQDDGLAFDVRAVEQPGLRPVRLEGRFADGELVLGEAVTAAFEFDARRPASASREGRGTQD
jgi:hypothetical protein